VPAVEISTEERLGIDDVFDVRVFAEPDLSGSYRVAADGTVGLSLRRPHLGRWDADGDVQDLIASKLRDGYLKKPEVSVMVEGMEQPQSGGDRPGATPGVRAYFPRMTIVDAIASAGGFTGIAAKNHVTLRREVKGTSRAGTARWLRSVREGRPTSSCGRATSWS